MYEIENDTIYCYPGTSVLKNKLDLRSQDDLDAFEAEITAQRAAEPLPSGDMDYAHYCAIHHHLFQDVYPWAGQPRTIRIGKDGNWFCFPEHIDANMGKLFAQLENDNYLLGLNADDFTAKAAVLLAELNAIHPFREGNGRTQLSFLVELSERAGHGLNLDRLDPQAFLRVMIDSFSGSEKPLAHIIGKLIDTV